MIAAVSGFDRHPEIKIWRALPWIALGCLFACLWLGTVSARAGTWTIGGPIVNNTNSADPTCPPFVQSVGCVWVQNWASDGMSLENGTTQGNIPVGIASGETQPLLFFAEQYDEGADWWAAALGPDERNWVLTVRDDVNDRTGRYAGCAESTNPSQQGAPQFVRLPSWSGSDSGPTTGFAFEPSASAPTVAAGQYCSTSSASFSHTTDCATSSSSGNISFVPIVSDVMVNIAIVNTGNNAAAISIGPGGYQQQWCESGLPTPKRVTCRPTASRGDINIWPADGQAGTPVSVEVTGVSYGLLALNAPTEARNR